jgi:hypothetical protein
MREDAAVEMHAAERLERRMNFFGEEVASVAF